MENEKDKIKAETPKPIFIVLIPNMADSSILRHYQSEIEDRMKDYHVIVSLNNKDEFDFKAFYSKDFQTADLEELKIFLRETFDKKTETI